MSQNVSPMPYARTIFMVDPEFFEVVDTINPHMQDASGKLNVVDRTAARQQWQTLHDTYVKLGLKVTVIPGVKGLPDMCFAANQALPFVTRDGKKVALASRMRHPSRKPEVEPYCRGLQQLGYEIVTLDVTDPDVAFEGMGDALWVPGKRVLCGGFGPRTDKSVYEKIEHQLDCQVIPLQLLHPRFYHLDTCLSIINETTAVAYLEAFTPADQKILRDWFPNLIALSLEEADSPHFAGNCHSPDGVHVIFQENNPSFSEKISRAGLKPVPVPTSEYIKSGGSVFCLKMALF